MNSCEIQCQIYNFYKIQEPFPNFSKMLKFVIYFTTQFIQPNLYATPQLMNIKMKFTLALK